MEPELQYIPLSLFFKPGKITLDNGKKIDGEQTILAFKEACEQDGYSWFGMDCLKNGLSVDKARMLENMLQQQRVYLYFGIHNEHYDNELAFRCEITEVVNDKEGCKCPEGKKRPAIFQGDETSKTWFKIKNVETCREEAESFEIASTGSNLKYVISHSRFFFGYIRESI